MKFIICPAGVYQANCYIIYDEKTSSGFIVDPGGDAGKIRRILKDECIDAKFIILTHGHFDHTGAVNELKDCLNIPVYMNEKDLFLVSGSEEKPMEGTIPESDKIKIDRFVKEGDIISYGDEKLTVLETPGHSPGGITLSTGGCLFTGDTIFHGSVGRTDLKGGSMEQLEQSVDSILSNFPDDTLVYPGHGPSTTIGFEKMNDTFI